MTLPFHPLANIFPLIEGPEFDDLTASVKASGGPRDPIILYEGSILDGRNRARACEAAGVDPRYETLAPGVSALAYVIDKNLRRRHLNESQRAFAAAKLANLSEGRPAETASIEAVSQPDAAARLNVSRASVQRAAEVQSKATPEIQRAVERGKLPVSAAAQAAKLAPQTQRKIAEEAEAGRANVVRSVIKQESRGGRESELAQKIAALPTRKFGVILADPEWRFEPWSRATGLDRAADNHYPTSCTEVIAARDVPSIAADDCVLFLWATAPMLPHALLVMSAWGFDYRSHFIWAKDRIGTGYWNRNKHELLLVGVRGNPPAPAPGTQWPSLIEAPVGEHSAKPERFHAMIEFHFPSLPKIELNRRGPPRPGWEAWGNQAQPVDASGSALKHNPETGEIIEIKEESRANVGDSAVAMESASAGVDPASRLADGRTSASRASEKDAPQTSALGVTSRERPAPLSDDDLDIPDFLKRRSDNSIDPEARP